MWELLLLVTCIINCYSVDLLMFTVYYIRAVSYTHLDVYKRQRVNSDRVGSEAKPGKTKNRIQNTRARVYV